MNKVISRAFAKIASPSPTLSTQKWQHYASLFLQSYTYATTASTSKIPRQYQRRGGAAESSSSKSKSKSTAEVEAEAETAAVASSEWARPSEIPFQAKIANSVNVIGYVHVPVQFESSPDGKCWAGTVLTQTHQISPPPSSPDSPPLWIPIIFEGDLAHIAARHLKEKNFVHVTGRLSADPPHLNANQGQANIQVMVHSLNFVQPSFQMKNSSTSPEQKWSLKRLASVKNEDDISQSWKLVSQSNLRDIRLKEDNPKVAAYEQKEDDLVLADVKRSEDSKINSWRELLDDPKQWWDNRDSKRSGSVNPKSPDFKHKVGGHALWLTDAPSWVLSELGVEVDVKTQKSKQVKQHRGEESWKDLVQNPTKWWDNRLNKRNHRSPDFKHKDTGEGLWLNGSPDWVLPKLPPLKGNKV
ncbi:protein OSB2, chloroplastic-like isoform X2 [Quercus lobata]|uniref:protein OSB2, chloroplastic-like isoform X2 n=1 Tax=Quercus lobata TaxID=97700 RepID=UPI001247BCA5|nr:protein OSB2, chloroplastic-like isoform X2 [Quercus lobata]